MGYQTKQNLSNEKFQQSNGSTLNLSGDTVVANNGSLRYQSVVIITGETEVVHKSYVDNAIIAVTSGESIIYNGSTPASVNLGGISVGYQLTGRTANQILENLLVPTLNPTLTNPSITSFTQNLVTTQEVGLSVIPTFTTNFSRGSISPAYGTSGFRSGLPTSYVYSGNGNVRTVISSALSNVSPATGTTILVEGVNTWGVLVNYGSGEQPRNSSGGNFSSPLPAGATPISNTIITGRFLRFFGPTSSVPVNSSQVRTLPNNALQTSNIMTFVLNTGTVQNRFVVALPPGRTISSVFDLDSANANITSSYILTGTILVNDGGGTGTPRTYNLYVLTLGAPYSSNHRHEITTA